MSWKTPIIACTPKEPLYEYLDAQEELSKGIEDTKKALIAKWKNILTLCSITDESIR